MSADRFFAWEFAFRKAARLDRYEVFSSHLEQLGLEADPKVMVDGTVNLVRMSAAYAQIDNQPIINLLMAQAYNPAPNPEMPYICTFDICGKAYGRLFVDKEFKLIDLADLYGSPWEEYRAVGYYQFWITRSDGRELSFEEMNDLEELVRDDLYFDYSEDELVMQSDPADDYSFLHVTLFDAPDVD